jgi:YidC/Oxa1 family membrane protein insertase
MDKRTIIAVVLAVVVIIGSMIIQERFFASPEPAPAQSTEPADTVPEPVVEEQPAEEVQQQEAAEQPGAPMAAQEGLAMEADQQIEEQNFTIDTDVFRVGFTNRGGQITSIELKEYSNTDGSPVEMIFSQESGVKPFSIHFGDVDAPTVDALFQVERSLVGYGVTFSSKFRSPTGVPFTLKKSYLLHDGDYMIELKVSIENSINEYPALNYDGYAYTLGFGPQIGPEFEKLDRRNEFRQYLYYADGKKQSLRMKQEAKQIDTRVTWASIAGKYFAVIAVPDATQYLITYDTRQIEGLNEQSSLYFSRPEIKASRNTDTFRFYIGPKKLDILKSYNDPEKNAYDLGDMKFNEIASRSPLIGWLVEILKFFLELFYRLIPNYGVAIILVTILLKVLLFPLTHKSYESTARMQALQPKMNELREKFKNNPQKLNQEMAAMYKKEGVSPLGGCLPMLLQFPILIAFYGLLNTHFALRGAVFIPGWINDLSAPEAVITFSPISITRNFQFDAIRALPFIMLVTTFLSSKLMQSPSTDASGRNMKMMTYMMPVMFFFILYNMPSGLLLYWTMQNIFTVAQQWYINHRRQKKNAEGVPGPGPVRTGPVKKKK